MTSYKDVLAKRERLGPDGKAVWPLRTQEWPSRQQKGKIYG